MAAEKTGYLYMWISKIIIAALIGACLFLSKCALDSLKDCSITVSETTTHIVKSDSCPTEEKFKEKNGTNFDYIRKPQRPHRPDKIIQKKVNLYSVFCIVYVVILAGTIVTLLVLFVKDDSYIKCAKLNTLHEVKEVLLNKEFENSVDKTERVVEDVNSNAVTKTTTTTETTDNRVKLLKHYMSCVADI